MVTDFALENAKLIMLFTLIGTVIGLSHLNADNLAKVKFAIGRQLWRAIGRMSKTTATVS